MKIKHFEVRVGPSFSSPNLLEMRVIIGTKGTKEYSAIRTIIDPTQISDDVSLLDNLFDASRHQLIQHMKAQGVI